MASAGTERARPAGVAGIFGANVSAIEKSGLFLFVDAGGDVAENVLIGIDEAMARSNVARRAHAEKAEARAAGMRFVHALVQFGQRVADVGEAVQLAAQSELHIFLGEF